MATQHDNGRYRRDTAPSDRSAAEKSSKAAAEEAKSDFRSPGRVEFDSRGNSVWRWDNEQDESTSILLKRLENDDLALEPTRPVPVLGRKAADRKSQAKAGSDAEQELAILTKKNGGGFDPYNRS